MGDKGEGLASFRNCPWRNCTSDNIDIYDYYVVSEHTKSTGLVIYVSDAVTSSPPSFSESLVCRHG